MWKREKISGWHFTDFLLEGNKEAKRVYLLLHGYGQNCDSIIDELKSALPANALILAPNGPFPLPQRTSKGLYLNFAWYFYDNIRNTYHIDYQLPATILKELAQTLNLNKIPMTVIGFSQGGYLSPFVANMISSVDHVIGISCRFCYERLGKIGYRIDGIHGRSDSIVDPDGARKSHGEMISKGGSGKFYLFEEGHKLGGEFKNCVKNLVGAS
ncbi:MAG: hypothetical protein OXB84_05575 [Halobacteriovoraceae bacterium]|nr:hypothetical protein [Halobacteriovoraceae bacterium]